MSRARAPCLKRYARGDEIFNPDVGRTRPWIEAQAQAAGSRPRPWIEAQQAREPAEQPGAVRWRVRARVPRRVRCKLCVVKVT